MQDATLDWITEPVTMDIASMHTANLELHKMSRRQIRQCLAWIIILRRLSATKIIDLATLVPGNDCSVRADQVHVDDQTP